MKIDNNLRIDPSTIAQTFLIATLLALTTTVLQLRQDVALLRDQMQNFILAKEFAAFKVIAEQHDEQYEKRLVQIERKLEQHK
ncbi:hypothetical protein Syn7502_01472 [Synechococcus sp. PCC 7502]|uniref:hypothetical protein n=1 Tax=Synechococcus sp. PCC 7502 TaxID=1173263 RepID=UPI00029F9D6E|nr:hypothetical protein [Synechococcus sp. PCC 7502]AFY73540.1 hypothetical protein Syn7502_01472 [Synechococcus sp. PCC 7502]